MDHTHNDCLLITVMTHGDFGTISSYDEDYTIMRITSHFTDEACPSLIGKPRIFFIQACRGNKLDSGHEIKIRRDLVYSTNRNDNHSQDSRDIQLFGNGNAELEDFLHLPPNHEHFLVVRSTMPSYLSFRNTTKGSWFIQDLCLELEENGTKHDILNLLTHVNWKVSERESSGQLINKKKQILCISSMLTKILIFNSNNNC